MKQKVLVNVTVECSPPSHVTRWIPTLEKQAKALESWASDFNDFIRDHRSQDPIDLYINREYEEQCSHCGYTWEEDSLTGEPQCCGRAQQEWLESKQSVA